MYLNQSRAAANAQPTISLEKTDRFKRYGRKSLRVKLLLCQSIGLTIFSKWSQTISL